MLSQCAYFGVYSIKCAVPCSIRWFRSFWLISNGKSVEKRITLEGWMVITIWGKRVRKWEVIVICSGRLSSSNQIHVLGTWWMQNERQITISVDKWNWPRIFTIFHWFLCVCVSDIATDYITNRHKLAAIWTIASLKRSNILVFCQNKSEPTRIEK